MSEAEVRQYIEEVLKDTSSHMISTESAVAAAQQMAEIAEKEEIEWAIAGGVAMHFYGSPRLTKDLDIIASKATSLAPQHGLSFGGSSYKLQVNNTQVNVDWIVRNDNYRKYYQAALRDAIELSNGLRVITPVWLVILKYMAGRQKDLDDIVFLLKRPKRIDRSAIKQRIIDTAGEDTWYGMLPNWRRLFDLADGNTKEQGKYYDQE